MPFFGDDDDDSGFDFDDESEDIDDEEEYEEEDEDDEPLDEEEYEDEDEEQLELTGEPEDYEDDTGDWTEEDYEESAESLFGDNEYFGEELEDQLAEEGFEVFDDPGFLDNFERVAPGASETVQLFERDGRLHAFGFIPMALAAILRQQFTGIIFDNLHCTVPMKGEIAEPQPLPKAFAALEPALEVDMRKFATPVGDQAETSRCSAFAWTHAVELSKNIDGQQCPRLSPNFTMLQFQRMQGDAQDYGYAYEGGSGTVSGTDPGELILQNGSCRQEFWPDSEQSPKVSERQMAGDAARFRLECTAHPTAVDDLKKVLTAGCPVHLSMNTGPAFAKIGRDGVVSAAEQPDGRHGRHAMLITGYKGNFYIVKNSWGQQWGDGGYCYIPKNVLAASDAEFIAVLPEKPR